MLTRSRASKVPSMVKRLIVACDGTWVNSDNGFKHDSWLPWKSSTGRLVDPSNVTRICRAILPRDKDVPQITYYQAGLGSQDNLWSYIVGGYLGEGISENIREAYAFICNNWEPGDEIILIGFSRGAFTARSIGGLISAIGLLTKRGMSSFYPIYKDWESQNHDNFVPTYGSRDWPIAGRPKFSDPAYLQKLIKAGLTRYGEKGVPIKAVGVWDTVGALGVPDIKILRIPLHTDSRTEFAFINTQVANNIEHAYQALALDEERTPFAPTVWESPKPDSGAILKELKQCWFPGVHTNVGGGYQDTSIADLTLAWMMTQLAPHVALDQTYIAAQRKANQEFYEAAKQPVRPYGTGLIPATNTGLVSAITGYGPRTPGTYHVTDPKTGQQLPTRLKKTHEFMHPSVRYRIDTKGKGPSNDPKSDPIGQGVYTPAALKGWTYCPPNQPWGRDEFDFGDDAARWDSYGKWIRPGNGPDKNGKKDGVYIVESRIEKDTAEAVVLDGWGPTVRSIIDRPTGI